MATTQPKSSTEVIYQIEIHVEKEFVGDYLEWLEKVIYHYYSSSLYYFFSIITTRSTCLMTIINLGTHQRFVRIGEFLHLLVS